MAAMKAALDANPPSGLLRLVDWGVIRAHGADAGSFLQGQLTNDVLLAPGEARLAGYCSPKGRLLASFVVWREDAGDLLLACSADLLPATLKRLSMFVLRAKCKLSDASAEVPLWGLAGQAALAALGDAAPRRTWQCSAAASGQAIRLPDAAIGTARVPRFLLAATAAPDLPDLPALDASAWRWLEVMSGTARISAATQEQFVPQMVNLELVGGVNFQKGCFPGQEVVARSQYRGTLKRRAAIVASSAPLHPGQEVFHDADPGQPAGMVVLAGSHGAHHAALVELKLAAQQGGTLSAPGTSDLGTPGGGALELLPLPYPIPAGAA